MLSKAASFLSRGLSITRNLNGTAPLPSVSLRAVSSSLHASESFLNGTNSVYVEEMYRLWSQDPSKVHASWDTYFRNVEAGLPAGQAFLAPPDIQPGVAPVAAARAPVLPGGQADDKSRVMHLIRAFQVRGHELADVDPLGLRGKETVPELDPATYGFTEADMSRTVDLTGFEGVKGFAALGSTATLGELIQKLKECYCQRIGFEYMHISSREKCNWIRERIELAEPLRFDAKKKELIYDRLAWADKFERFVGLKFNTAKRFGLEGCESMIPGIKAMIDRATELGVEHAVFGMPHRGRLNVLTNVIRKPLESIFREFQGTHVDLEAYDDPAGNWSGSGDVKYHLGTSFDRTYPDGRKVHMALVANPSHLEAVNPVVCGKVRAKQDNLRVDDPQKAVMGVLIHGDAAFAGQGIVYETMQMSQVPNFATGGTVHVVCNNQIGFTTDPSDSRSTRYCSDIGKAFEAPVFHVNADDPEAVTRAFELATEWRQTWRSDVVIDLIGYRRYGHNELDEPAFTQPLMYGKIKDHKDVLAHYREALLEEGVVDPKRIAQIDATVDASLEEAFDNMADHHYQENWLSSHWAGFHSPRQLSRIRETGVPREQLEQIGAALTAVPEGFEPHKSVARILKAKKKALDAGEGLDWATAEALAFGTLLSEGNRVRLSGQDVERGTFSHRHSVLHDRNTNDIWAPLQQFGADGADDRRGPLLSVGNSILSEFGVMGFELGYSLEEPNSLILWEAQFGDFVNGAQIMIDQFFTSGEQKWKRQCGLTLLLPHGYDGQGPEHSSSRYERFLQASDEDESVVPEMDEDSRRQIQMTNIQVVNCSTPANYFHVLRRQVHRNFRKPLVVVSPKALLRLKECSSSFDEMAEGTRFQRVIRDPLDGVDGGLQAPENVRRVVFCTGKVFYDVDKARRKANIDDVALVRVEQLAPFPFDKVAKQAARYPNAEVVWCQEEPKNMGAWSHVAPRIRTALRELNDGDAREARYIGRAPAASPAVGVASLHDREQKALIAATLQKEE